jgi:8-amino-7-oxononanoate synthase
VETAEKANETSTISACAAVTSYQGMAGDSSLEQRIARRIAALRDARLLRTLDPPRGIDLSSNDYLALSQHPLLKGRMIEAVRREGCGSTGSRLLRGERDSFASLERTFAAFKHAGRALYFSSGYLANLAVMTTFPEAGDAIFSDERNHASLIDGIRLSAASRVVFPHNDVGALARLLDEHREGQAFVVIESLFSMDGDVAPLAEYAALCRATGAALIIDEAHAVGICGARGSGLVEANGLERDVFVTVNTAGKALGVSGAFVAGPPEAIEYLIQRARPFIFSTASPPAVADAIEASLSIVASEPERRQRLARLARHLRNQLCAADIPVAPGDSHIIPVIVGSNERALAVAQTMQAEGFDVRAIRPPSVPENTARLRITVNVGLDEPTLDRFAAMLAVVLEGLDDGRQGDRGSPIHQLSLSSVPSVVES